MLEAACFAQKALFQITGREYAKTVNNVAYMLSSKGRLN